MRSAMLFQNQFSENVRQKGHARQTVHHLLPVMTFLYICNAAYFIPAVRRIEQLSVVALLLFETANKIEISSHGSIFHRYAF